MKVTNISVLTPETSLPFSFEYELICTKKGCEMKSNEDSYVPPYYFERGTRLEYEGMKIRTDKG